MSQKKRLLILDDFEDTAELLTARLASDTCETVKATSGLQALKEIFTGYRQGKPFAALLLDCALPHFDGFTIARIVRTAEESGLGPRAKIAFITAYGETVESSTLLQEVGADAYWRKPDDFEVLPTLVEQWLANKTHTPQPQSHKATPTC
jgi:CheY-like chemotaxis protein